MTASAKAKKILDQIGPPQEIARSLRKFRRAARALSSASPRLVTAYPNKWVILFDGEVKAAVTSFRGAMAKAKALNLPKDAFFVRYIAKKRQTMIFGGTC